MVKKRKAQEQQKARRNQHNRIKGEQCSMVADKDMGFYDACKNPEREQKKKQPTKYLYVDGIIAAEQGQVQVIESASDSAKKTVPGGAGTVKKTGISFTVVRN